jgi:hypothetical protein
MMEMGGFSSTGKGFHKNDKKLAPVATSVAGK